MKEHGLCCEGREGELIHSVCVKSAQFCTWQKGIISVSDGTSGWIIAAGWATFVCCCCQKLY